jgi:putative PIN family toxin of toxin-antitoxin system
MRVVCDTNILISALIFPGGNPDKVIQLARTKEIDLYISPFILNEFERVLKEKFNYTENEVKKRLERIINISTIVNPKEHISVVTEDEADNRILECAIEAKADFYHLRR